MQRKILNRRVALELVLLGLLILYIGLQVFFPEKAKFPVFLKTPQDYHLFAKSLTAKGDLDKAEKAANTAIALNKRFYKAYLDLGLIYTKRGDYVKAKSFYLKGLKYVSQDKLNREVAYYNLGGLYERERMPVKAWKYFRLAYTMRSYLSDTQYWEDSSLKELKFVMSGDRGSFIRSLKEHKYTPQEVLRRINAIKQDFRKGHYGKIVDECQQYLNDNPRSIYSYIFIENMVYALVIMEKYALAAEKLRLLDSAPLDKEHKDWINYIKAIVAFNQNRPREFWKRLANIIDAGNDYKSMLRTYRTIEETISTNKEAVDLDDIDETHLSGYFKAAIKYRLALAFYRDRKYDKALEIVNNIFQHHKVDKKQYPIYALKAKIYEKKKDMPKAKESINKYLLDHPKGLYSKFAHLALMQMYIKEGDYIRGYEELRDSRLGLMIEIASVVFAALFLGFFMGLFIIFSQLCFRTKIRQIKEDSIFNRFDLYIFLLALFCMPFILLRFFLFAYYHFRPVFDTLWLDPLLAAVLVSNIFMVILSLFILKRKYKFDDVSLGLVSRGYKYNIIIPLVIVVITFSILALFASLYQGTGVEVPSSPWRDVMRNLLAKKNASMQFYPLFVILVFIGPIAEEIIYRVFLCNIFEKYTNLFTGIMLSSIFFAIAHQPYVLLPYYMVIGLILGLLYKKTKTVLSPIITHALYNFIFVAFSFLLWRGG